MPRERMRCSVGCDRPVNSEVLCGVRSSAIKELSVLFCEPVDVNNRRCDRYGRNVIVSGAKMLPEFNEDPYSNFRQVFELERPLPYFFFQPLPLITRVDDKSVR